MGKSAAAVHRYLQKKAAGQTLQEIQNENYRLMCAEMKTKVIPHVRGMSLVTTLKVLHDEFGFGIKRLSRFIDKLEEQYDCIEAEYTSFEELKRMLLEELGVDVDAIEQEQRERMERDLIESN